MPASLVYSKSVIARVFIALFVEYPEEYRWCFRLCHNLRLHKLKNCGIAYLKEKLFWFHVLDCNAIFANQDLLPTLRPGNFDLHTKMPGPPLPEPQYTNVQFVPIYFSSAGGVNASAGVLFNIG